MASTTSFQRSQSENRSDKGGDFVDKAKDAGATAMDKAKEFAGAAADAVKAKEFAATAADKAKEFAGTAADKAKEFAGTAADKAKEAASNIGKKAEDATHAVGSGMQSLAGTVREHLPREGVLGAAGSTVAGGLEAGGSYLEHEGLEGMAKDLTNLIKRNPVPAVLVGIGLGFLLARVTMPSRS